MTVLQKILRNNVGMIDTPNYRAHYLQPKKETASMKKIANMAKFTFFMPKIVILVMGGISLYIFTVILHYVRK